METHLAINAARMAAIEAIRAAPDAAAVRNILENFGPSTE
jgi:hypothetical protein